MHLLYPTFALIGIGTLSYYFIEIFIVPLFKFLPINRNSQIKSGYTGNRISIPVGLIEFNEGGNTIWIQSEGGTILRIKTLGKIKVDKCKTSPVSHADIIVKEDINFCVSEDAK